ncbi:stage II sporulation protein E [candidate division KSB3 bacterium]|uniref:Stage II sporulation protein E n=1 Tax=candidate division KSB3 bacterium TaxID=2044937 RepID=A0A2G6KAI7_9BACT|nr:MAG: stage II sporulation protein E [candidate division KSB3 bacterium]
MKHETPTDSSEHYVIEVDHFQQFKRHQQVGGDTFFSTRIREENRTISILSDGLGSGIKASVLSTLTAVMAARFTAGYRDVKKTAEIIMRTLPVCSVRNISYATFTIVDIDESGIARIIEYDNPPAVILRDGKIVDVQPTLIEGQVLEERSYQLNYYQFPIQHGDRIICFSDGVTQSGVGFDRFPLGWGWKNAANLLCRAVRSDAQISARKLARQLVEQAIEHDAGAAMDDVTCGVVYYREPRELLIVSGPPVDRANDSKLAQLFKQHRGRKIVCGGTTSKLLDRELGTETTLALDHLLPDVPPESTMEGADLVTEGIITLQHVADLLKDADNSDEAQLSPARKIVDMMFDSDVIHFVVGTRINEAYQDPHLPEEIALRRSIVREIVHHLETIYLKETSIQFI